MNNKLSAVTFPCFTQEHVKKINEEIKKNISKKELLEYASKIGEFSIVECMPLMNLVFLWLNKCQQLNRNIFGYDTYWSFHLDTFNYNVYGPNGKYDWHIDGYNQNIPTDIKLTCLLNLSEELYEGGEFSLINHSDEPEEFTSGMGLVFNSLIAHKVTPVTKGERITLTYWALGPSWR